VKRASAANADRGRRKMYTNASAVRHDAKDVAQKAKVVRVMSWRHDADRRKVITTS